MTVEAAVRPRRGQRIRRRGLVVAVAAVLFAAACTGTDAGDDVSTDADDVSTGATDASAAVPSVVVTTGIWADVVSNVGCDDSVSVTTIIPPGGDPHAYEPSLRDRETMGAADLVVANGLALEERLEDTLEAVAAEGVHVFKMSDHIETIDFEFEAAHHDHDEDDGHDEHDDEDGHEDEHGHDDDGTKTSTATTRPRPRRDGHDEDEHDHDEDDGHEDDDGHDHDEDGGHDHEDDDGHEDDGHDGRRARPRRRRPRRRRWARPRRRRRPRGRARARRRRRPRGRTRARPLRWCRPAHLVRSAARRGRPGRACRRADPCRR